MDEAEVSYASVVFKSDKTFSSKAKKDEKTVYDEVKGQHKTSDTKVSAGYLQDSDKKAEKSRCPRYQCLACCLGILCVILLSTIIAMSVYIALKQQSDVSERLTNQNKQLSSEIENLKKNCNNQNDQLTQAKTVLERNFTILREINQELESQKKNLTQQIKDMKTTWNKDNVTRAQWSIDTYCPKGVNGRQCKACQSDWKNVQTSCYAINNAPVSNQKTWEEARENCRGKSSDLAVIVTEAEKTFTTDNSWHIDGNSRYWIGLKVEDGRWKWVDGSELTNKLQIEPKVDGNYWYRLDISELYSKKSKVLWKKGFNYLKIIKREKMTR